MHIVLSLLGISIALIVHELAHAEAMRKYGIRITRIGFGIPLPGLPPIFRWQSRKRYLGAEIKVNHLPLGAYVTPADDSRIDELPLRARLEIYGAGLLWNVLLAIGCFMLFFLQPPWSKLARVLTVDAVFAVFGFALWRFRQAFFRLTPILCLVVVGFSIYSSISGAASISQGLGETFGGPVAVIETGARGIKNLADSIVWLGSVSLMLFLMNGLPFLPFDGGRIAEALLVKRWSSFQPVLRTFGLIVTLGLFLLVIGSDLARLASYMFK